MMAQGIDGDRERLLSGDWTEVLEKYGGVIKDRMESIRQRVLAAADEDIHQVEQSRRNLLHQVQRMMEEFDYKLREVGSGYASRKDGCSRENNVGCLPVLKRFGSNDQDDPTDYFEEHLNEVMDLLGEIQFNREKSQIKLAIGHIVHPKILRLVFSMKLPENTGQNKRSLTALSNGSVAIGHNSGGVDIFRLDTGIKRIVNDITVRDISACSDGRLMVLGFDRQIHVFDQKGKALQTLSPHETCFMFSVTVDRDDMLFVGDCELEQIFSFDLKGETKRSVRTIPTAATTPWQLSALSTGNLLVADPCPPNGPAIKLLDRSGSVLSTIRQEEWSNAWCTVDQEDNIYVVFSRKGVEKQVSIDVYSSDGKLVENLTRNLKIPKFQWLSVAVPSRGSIVICTETYLFLHTWQSQFH